MENNIYSLHKICKNCGAIVEKNYCAECGQKYTNKPQTFFHLFFEALSGLFNYDSIAWQTLRNLLYRPAKLSIAYINGKYIKYVNPVKLYLFISFITFFIISVLPSSEDSLIKIMNQDDNQIVDNDGEVKELENSASEKIILSDTAEENEDIEKQPKRKKSGTTSKWKNIAFNNAVKSCNTIEELELFQNNSAGDAKLSTFQFLLAKAYIVFNKQKGVSIFQSLFEKYFPNFLFVYMPLFAFWLWLFSRKKDFYLFDCTVFTLHLFSLILILITFYYITEWAKERFSIEWLSLKWTGIILFLYFNLYFFKAFRVFFRKGWFVSIVKGGTILTINAITFTVVFSLFITLLLYFVLIQVY